MQKNIAILLVLLMGFSILPYNAFHNHTEDLHFEAMFGHQEEKHHCELDDYNCQDFIGRHCDHSSHVSESHPDCFTCQFHFFKHYEITQYGLNILVQNNSYTYESLLSNLVWAILPLAANKGPPYLA
jgi:hypothetical protein